ncbi:MAG: zinc ribbon domain-containing protein [Lentimicrobium sp.]
MALIKCPECGMLVSERASNCPHCGYKNKKSGGCGSTILIFILVIIVVYFIDLATRDNSNRTTTPYKSTEQKWYEGGTLHKATIAEWRTATTTNKLATCSDFVAKIRQDKGIAFDESEIKKESYDLMNCIDAAIIDVDVDNWKVSEMAATCLVLLK